MSKTRYSMQELDELALADIINDAEASEQQAEKGPLYLEKGVTRESLLSYAARMRRIADKYKNGGAHKAVLSGRAFQNTD